LEYEWDERKARQNIAKHGVPFEYASRVFLDLHRLDTEDTRRDYGEERRLCVVAYTARKANEREWRKYVETLSA
jgi:uncharacterized DUF497 family protein